MKGLDKDVLVLLSFEELCYIYLVSGHCSILSDEGLKVCDELRKTIANIACDLYGIENLDDYMFINYYFRIDSH